MSPVESGKKRDEAISDWRFLTGINQEGGELMRTRYQRGKQIDHYEILQRLEQGVASEIYLARDRRTQREVVLKFPLDEVVGGRATFERYRREATIGKLLHHPHIQYLLNQGEKRSQYYLVVEYLRGRTLRTLMREHACAMLPLEDILSILTQVGEAVAYAHERGVIHRDIKPENIIVMETGETKIIDFGIALLENQQTHQGWWQSDFSPLVGTPDYMAPERLCGACGDVRTDIYAIGIILYELLCGHLPFEELDGFAFTSQHISYDPPDIRRFAPTLSPALATVTMRAIRRQPERRYASRQELLSDLSHLDTVTPLNYLPDPPLLGGRYRHVVHLAFLTLVFCLAIVALSLLVQMVHQLVVN